MARMRMRSTLAFLTVLVVPVVSVSGCKDDPAGAAATEQAVAATAELSASEQELLARRDALLGARRKLRDQRQALAAERARVLARGGDTAEVDAKVSELFAKEHELGAKEHELDQDFDELLQAQREVLASIASRGGQSAQMAAREASIAGREKVIAARETRVAERERELAAREATLARRERSTCGGAGAAPVIIQQSAPSTKYTRRDVEPLLERARRHMGKKGLLISDLPEPMQGLEREATRAMAKGDFASARFAASQLMATVDATAIDRAFLQAKIRRLDGKITSKKPSDSTRKQVDELFRDATGDYGDGKFASANKHLNAIYALIGR